MQQPAEEELLTSTDKILMNIETVIHKTNREIYDHGRQNEKCYGMGTTISVLVLWENNALIGHVGDSRIYRQRNNSLEQLTVDQTETQSMVEKGYITPKQATSHPYRHVLLQALGVSQTLDTVMTRHEAIKAGDIFLLSSDGLHDLVSDTEIEKTLTDYSEPKSVCENLVKLALSDGGKDNITVVVVKVLEGD
jgi:protein phosphatase